MVNIFQRVEHVKAYFQPLGFLTCHLRICQLQHSLAVIQSWGTLYFLSSTTLCHTLKNWTLGRNSFPSISNQEVLGHHSVDYEFEIKTERQAHLQQLGKGANHLVLAVLPTFKNEPRSGLGKI